MEMLEQGMDLASRGIKYISHSQEVSSPLLVVDPHTHVFYVLSLSTVWASEPPSSCNGFVQNKIGIGMLNFFQVFNGEIYSSLKGTNKR